MFYLKWSLVALSRRGNNILVFNNLSPFCKLNGFALFDLATNDLVTE